jgi:thymidine kinase
MFIEPFIRQQSIGWVEVICGCMFSGKTEELIRRLKRAQIASQKVTIFKPFTDKRYHESKIVSHDANSIPSKPVSSSKEILTLSDGYEVIGIDEAQFFDAGLPEVCEELADKGLRLIVAGLDMDFAGNPFGVMPHLLARAEYVTKFQAICVVCGNPASYSFRKTADENTILIGEKEHYEPRCRKCFRKGRAS